MFAGVVVLAAADEMQLTLPFVKKQAGLPEASCPCESG
jgi:hypothetical protein